ncbi:hypothetical protein HYH02_003055 [Chlamydomonas schloesseri]|uniref:BTB domain-containing protein n=1 Tax=Chlamydomonas schloesseri TaxID=2026947 RepID=A0A835WRC2_9CHLO|nr:hypothetical protein HYH02_003055 [Chlamydomonas schloesseri]|eukprot:KAG2452014.1 hypothetical protein HYH02_003055 [Chlamydomonas schloesseri]
MGRKLCPLLGADGRHGCGFELGEPLRLFRQPSTAAPGGAGLLFGGSADRQPFDTGCFNIDTCVWDSWSASVFFKSGFAIFRLVGDMVTLVAGDLNQRGYADGPGPAARFFRHGVCVAQLASDGAGSIVFVEGSCIRRIQLPAAWRAAATTQPLAHPHTAPTAGPRSSTWGPSGAGSTATVAPGATVAASAAAGAAAAAAASAAVHGDDDDEEEGEPVAQVSTLPFLLGRTVHSAVCVLQPQLPPAGTAGAAACTGRGAGSAGWLVLGTTSALYRYPLPLPPPPPPPPVPSPAAAAAGPAPALAPAAAARGRAAAAMAAAAVAGPQAAPHQQQQPPPQQPPPQQPQLFAGNEGETRQQDGRGAKARFRCFHGITADAAGCIYLADTHGHNGTHSCVRRVSLDGHVTTLASVPANCWFPTILPNGQLKLVDFGLQPLLPMPSAAAAAKAAAAAAAAMKAAAAGLPPPRSLPADLGALLDAQPDDSSDLVIRVGERRFHVHRLILSSRCDYFKQRLAASGGFADGRAAELELPDADPDAFALLMRWLYTGGADIPLEHARGVAELADRLLLPELCDVALEAVGASVDVATIVDSLLWAAGCSDLRNGGGGFGELLGLLKGWYVAHYVEVAEEAGDSRARLAAEAPGLMVELMDAVLLRPRQQQQPLQQAGGRYQKRLRI